MSYRLIGPAFASVDSDNQSTEVSEYQQYLMVLAYALAAFLLFGAGLLCLRYFAVWKRRSRVRHSMIEGRRQ